MISYSILPTASPGVSALASGARCALHPVDAASNVCALCGNFTCWRCFEAAENGLVRCHPCLEEFSARAEPGARFRAALIDGAAFGTPLLLAVLAGLTGSLEPRWLVGLASLGVLTVAGLQLYLRARYGQSLGLRALSSRAGRR
jgi:hypothetical protein